ncbi:rhamnan synthesis F family protein [Ancylobacter pratisalsi]|uniref:Glycosyltransferase n=1 Tax=Ancylobacter pratisalsi TaxID=1745854 RepID=A0A6P1YN50_9HYPH|nr:rhamnan synthesis F family protein [Ancylobacter pratisalsi]QIB34482.1 glycosyltransferase [Ancylobacter pratisalsi]
MKITLPSWTKRFAFHKDGRPRRFVRKALFHRNGRPRESLKFLVQHKSGRPRRAFRDWMPQTALAAGTNAAGTPNRSGFDADWYLATNRDVRESGVSPLIHYQIFGRHEGRLPTKPKRSRPVTDVQLITLKYVPPGPRAALFVTHSPKGGIKPHVRHYLEALVREGIDVYVLVAADQPFVGDEPWLRDLASGLFVRENVGLDFAAWAHIMRAHRAFFDCQTLYLLNDSLLGPTSQKVFHDVIEKIDAHPAQIVGLTDNYERSWHIQSYFLAIKSDALRANALHEFVRSIVAFDDKDDVINTYEVKFAPTMRAAGIPVGQLFDTYDDHNPTIFRWRQLLADGFPFIKVMTVRDDIPFADKTGWREALVEHGYDARLADMLLDELAYQRNFPLSPPCPRTPPVVSFISPWNYNNGLGAAGRGYLTAFMHARFPHKIFPIRRPFHIHQRIAPTFTVADVPLSADIAVVHLNPDGWSAVLDKAAWAEIHRALRTVGLFVWESPTLPDHLKQGLAKVDAVWAPTQFCADIFRPHARGPVHVVPHVVPVRELLSPLAERTRLRRRCGLGEDTRVILYIFDASSFLVRKNPHALVRAFARSGLGARGWQLVLKTKNIDSAHKDAADLLELCRSTNGVVLLDLSMPAHELNVLQDTADIYASSHCSEGFGLTIAEALARGTPVVATDYGGSRDFLNASTGFPVRYEDWTLSEDVGAYGAGTSWAKVDETHFAECLVAAAALSPEERAMLAERARAHLRNTLSPQAVARQMEDSVSRLLSEDGFAGRDAR